MMVIVSVLRQTGIFDYVAIWSAKRANGAPLRIMILLVLVTAIASALLDNVTTVLLIAPVTLLVCDRLALNPAPFLMAAACDDRTAVLVEGDRSPVGAPDPLIVSVDALCVASFQSAGPRNRRLVIGTVAVSSPPFLKTD